MEKYSICHFLWDWNHRTDYVKTWSSMTKNIEGIEGIKLSLEFVKIFTPSGVRGFRLFFHLKFSSLEVRELCDSRTGRTVCKLTSIIRREGKWESLCVIFPCSVFSVLSLPIPWGDTFLSGVTGPGSTPLHYWNYFGVCPKTVSPLTSSNNLYLISIFKMWKKWK